MSLPPIGLEDAFGIAGIGRWEFSVEARRLVIDEPCRLLFDISEGEMDLQDAVRTRVVAEDRARVFEALDSAVSEGDLYDEIFRITLPSGEQRWIRGVGKYRAQAGQRKVIGVSFDITSEQELLAERELHLAEMNHRIKNLFALVSAMISSAARASETKEEMLDELRGRVTALDRAHSMMLRTDSTQPVALGGLLERVLAPARAEQTILLSGAEVMIPARALTSLALILHEWVTNSAKYGALRSVDGQIKVTWEPYENGVHLTWKEQVPDYDAAAEQGFGSRLILASAMQLRAEKERRYEDGWLIIDMKLPLDGY